MTIQRWQRNILMMCVVIQNNQLYSEHPHIIQGICEKLTDSNTAPLARFVSEPKVVLFLVNRVLTVNEENVRRDVNMP